MRKQHRAQTLIKASVTADRRPMCSHGRKAASDSTDRDMSRQRSVHKRVHVMYGGNRTTFKSLCKPQTSRQRRNWRQSDVPIQIINSFPDTRKHTLPHLASALMSLVQSPFLSLSNTRKHGIPAFICTGASICSSKISIHPRYSPQAPGCTSVEQVRSSSATPTLRNQKVSVTLNPKLSEFFKPADSSGGYDWATVENVRVKIHPLNTGLNKD